MIDRLRTLLSPRIAYCILLPVTILLLLLSLFLPALTPGFWICLTVLLLYACRPGSLMHQITMEDTSAAKRLLTALVAIVTVSICILPMDQFPLWHLKRKTQQKFKYSIFCQ